MATLRSMLPISHLMPVTIATSATSATLVMITTPAASARLRIHAMAAATPIGAQIIRDRVIEARMIRDRVIGARATRWTIRAHLFNAAAERRRHPVGSDVSPIAITTCAARRAQLATTNGVEAASLARRGVHGVRNQATILTMTTARTMTIAWAKNIIVPRRHLHRIPAGAPTWNAATMLVADAAMATTSAPNVGRAVTGIRAEARSWSGIGNAAAIAAMPEERHILNHW